MLKRSIIASLILLTGCAQTGDIVDEAGGIRTVRSTCPAVAIPAQTGDITLFDPPASRDARAIDVTATISNVRVQCGDQGDQVVANATFDVAARRRDTGAARDVVLPYFSVVMRGGNVVIAKRISRVALHFDAGQARAQSSGQGGAVISRAAATLPVEVVERLRKKRKPTDPDASIDPMAAPDVRAAVARATFELLIGFQLTPDQLQYNATR